MLRVRFLAVVLKVLLIQVSCQCLWVWMKAGSDLYLTLAFRCGLPLHRVPLKFPWMGLMIGVNTKVIWVSSADCDDVCDGWCDGWLSGWLKIMALAITSAVSVLKWHSFHLFPVLLGVLKGFNFWAVSSFFSCCTVLECWAVIIANRLQVCSISPVDSAIWSCDHVWTTTVKYLTHSSCQPSRVHPVPCLFRKEMYLFIDFQDLEILCSVRCSRTALSVLFRISISLWSDLSSCWSILDASWDNCTLCWSACVEFLLVKVGLLAMGVSRNWKNALAWAVERTICFLCMCILNFLYHGLNETIWLVEMRGWSCMNQSQTLFQSFLKLSQLNGGPLSEHHNGGNALL